MTAEMHHSLDITGEVCPMTFVRVRLLLERLPPGAEACVKSAMEAMIAEGFVAKSIERHGVKESTRAALTRRY